MLTYSYTARVPGSNEKVKSEIQAESEAAAAKLIRGQGMTPVSIAVLSNGTSDAGLLSKITKRISTKDKILMTRQLATLLNAGLPLLQSLRNVSGQIKNKNLKAVMTSIINDVEGGVALSAALSRHPRVFSPVYISLVAAGETSGTLDASLERLATQQEKDAEVLAKVRGAMVYPLIVLAVMVMVVGFMIVKVLPQVKILYDSVGGASQLPFLTRLMLGISDLIIHDWWAIILVLVITGFFMTRWGRSASGKRVFDRLKMSMPPFGPLFMKLYMARFARTGTTLVASGVPLLQMLSVTSDAINNVHIQASMSRAIDKVKGGKALSESLRGDPNFLELVPSMIEIGEQSGSMEQMLSKIADYYEKEVDNQIKTISTIVEPMLMVILGVVAFMIVAAVLLPIYGLANKTFIR